MKRILGLFTLFLCGTTLLTAQETHIVDLAGTGDFISIHDAVEAASAGDTIRVQPDQYAFTANLGPVTIDKRLYIIGSGYMPVEEGGTELIDIPGTGYFDLTGSADGTVIKGFRVQGATGFIDTESGTANVTIEENLLINGITVMYFQGTADTVRSNIFHGTGHFSVRTTNSNTQITNNLFTENVVPSASTGLIYISNGSGVVVAYNLFLNTSSSQGFVRPDIYITSGAPEIYSNGFVNSTNNITDPQGNAFLTNNGFYNASPIGLNPTNASPDFENFDSENAELDLETLDENEFDLTLASGSGWINLGRTGTLYLDMDGSRSDIGLYAGPTSFSDGRGAPSVPVVINFQVSPTRVSPTGTITITATGRIGDGDN
jgi:hypothetical protein